MKSRFGKKEGPVGKSVEWYRNATYKPHGNSPGIRHRYRELVKRHTSRWGDPPMSEDEYAHAVSGSVCCWCQSDLFTSTSKSANGVGLDRIDNDRGYVVGNVNPCCPSCNVERGTLPHEEYALIWRLRRGKANAARAHVDALVAGEYKKQKRQALLAAGKNVEVERKRTHTGSYGSNRMDACRAELAKRIALREAGLDPDRPLPPPPDSLDDVARWRQEHGLTQRQAAGLMGVGVRTVQRAEAGGAVTLSRERVSSLIRDLGK